MYLGGVTDNACATIDYVYVVYAIYGATNLPRSFHNIKIIQRPFPTKIFTYLLILNTNVRIQEA